MRTTHLHHSTESGDFGFQIAPMVDVVFVLLLFFMAVAGQSQLERRLSSDLAHSPGTKVPILIDIDNAGRVSVGGALKGEAQKDPALAMLTGDLREAMHDSPDPVVIRPAFDTAQEYVIDVLAACKKASVPHIAFR